MEKVIKIEGSTWRLITVYSQNNKEILENIERNIEKREEEHLIIGGDFNARTDDRGGPREEEGDTWRRKTWARKSKDKVINKEGKILIDGIEERGWMIVNGSLGEEEEIGHM